MQTWTESNPNNSFDIVLIIYLSQEGRQAVQIIVTCAPQECKQVGEAIVERLARVGIDADVVWDGLTGKKRKGRLALEIKRDPPPSFYNWLNRYEPIEDYSLLVPDLDLIAPRPVQHEHSSLKRERELRGWSQARVAESIGVLPTTISRWERGTSTPYPYFQEKLCALFEMSTVELGLREDWTMTAS